MDKGYSGLNPYKSSTNNTNFNNVSAIASRIHDYVIVMKIDKISEEARVASKGHPYANPKHSPVSIPKNASVKKQRKIGYEQVVYKWKRGNYTYKARWHTKTPGAPDKKQSWVVSRKFNGMGYGKNARPSRMEILSGKKWVSWDTWSAAIKARQSGTATKSQIKLLNNGHFTRKRGK